MYKAAVIGRPGTVEAFRALGAEVFAATNPAEVEELLTSFTADYAIVLISEDLAPAKEVLVGLNSKQVLPAISLLPVEVSAERALEKLRFSLEKAVGADILGLGGE
ncbi:MAG: hypothetical protein GX058_00140 [Firmicutes bacterium]|nr:hypothetical protein [Bacillota bacterium]